MDNYDVITALIEDMHGEEVLRLFCNYHGTQLLSDDFVSFVKFELGIEDEDED